MANKYFEATVVFVDVVEGPRGGTKEKKTRERYLVEAETPSVVEAKVYKFLDGVQMDFRVEKVVESKISEVF
jgi:hypothetical protein